MKINAKSGEQEPAAKAATLKLSFDYGINPRAKTMFQRSYEEYLRLQRKRVAQECAQQLDHDFASEWVCD